MNGTKDDVKGHQEQDVELVGVLMPWNVECRDVCGLSREGGRSYLYVINSGNEGIANCKNGPKEKPKREW